MSELSEKTRAKIIIKLGLLLNYKMSSNISEPIVCELVAILDPENKIFSDEHYKKYITD